MCWAALFVFSTGNFFRVLLFYFKSRRLVANGEKMEFPEGVHTAWFRIIITTLLLAALMLLLISLCLESKEILVSVLISLAIIAGIIYFGIKLLRGIGSKKTKAHSDEYGNIVTESVSDDELLLTLEDQHHIYRNISFKIRPSLV